MSNSEVAKAPVSALVAGEPTAGSIPTATSTAAPAEPALKPEDGAAVTAVEPENALTKKFTDAERIALKELRVCLNIQ